MFKNDFFASGAWPITRMNAKKRTQVLRSLFTLYMMLLLKFYDT